MKWVGSEYCGIEDPADFDKWYTVTRKSLPPHTPPFLQAFGGLPNTLQIAFPDYNWDVNRFTGSGTSRTQEYLYEMIRRIYPSQGLNFFTFLLQTFTHICCVYQ